MKIVFSFLLILVVFRLGTLCSQEVIDQVVAVVGEKPHTLFPKYKVRNCQITFNKGWNVTEDMDCFLLDELMIATAY